MPRFKVELLRTSRCEAAAPPKLLSRNYPISCRRYSPGGIPTVRVKTRVNEGRSRWPISPHGEAGGMQHLFCRFNPLRLNPLVRRSVNPVCELSHQSSQGNPECTGNTTVTFSWGYQKRKTVHDDPQVTDRRSGTRIIRSVFLQRAPVVLKSADGLVHQRLG